MNIFCIHFCATKYFHSGRILCPSPRRTKISWRQDISTRMTHTPYNPLRETMTPTKPEVDNVHTTSPEEDRATATVTMHENRLKFVRAVFEICERTDKQTHRRAHHNTSHYKNLRAHNVIVWRCRRSGSKTKWNELHCYWLQRRAGCAQCCRVS